jgi:steroid 5-alpha reductase family enzyme
VTDTVGSYLFSRITSDNGTDSRFDNIRISPPKFFAAFMAQATWVSLCLLPVLSLNSIPTAAFASAALPAVTATDVLGVALFVGGFGFEVLADMQKNQWVKEKKEKKHSEEFLTRGLWGKSRHPNYFGEITLWTGIATVAGGILASSAGQKALGWSGSAASRIGAVALCAASPAFTTFLLTKVCFCVLSLWILYKVTLLTGISQVSGIPLSESKYDKRYGDRKDYQEWKKNTPMLIPKLT